MINKQMDKQNSVKTEETDNKQRAERKPNEQTGIAVSTHVKIHDPNTKQVFVQRRGDT
jgi:hypothetical protein